MSETRWTEPGRDTLTLNAIDTSCSLVGEAEDALAIEHRLERVCRDDLTDAIADLLRGRLDRWSADVVRIDRITLNLVLTREELDTSALPRLWAERIGAAIEAALAGADQSVTARFPGQGAFVAAYLEHRFGIARHPAFAFADFHALRHLSPSQAATELLAARPDYLHALARWSVGSRDPAWLARRINPADAAHLLRRLAAMSAPPAAAAPLAERLIATAPDGWRALPIPTATLALVLASLDAATANQPAAPLGHRITIAGAVATVAHIAQAAPDAVPLLIHGHESRAADTMARAGIAPHTSDSARASVAGPAGRHLVTAIATTLGIASSPIAPTGSTTATAPPTSTERDRTVQLDSPFAGFTFLLPVLRSLSADTLLSPGQARELIVTTLAPSAPLAIQAERLADFLVPTVVDTEPTPWPAATNDDVHTANADAWTTRVLNDFADRLPGLRASSAAYLRKQFLHHSGTLKLEPDRLTVHLNRPPLAIVLTIGGFTGELGPVPWRPDLTLQIVMS